MDIITIIVAILIAWIAIHNIFRANRAEAALSRVKAVIEETNVEVYPSKATR